MTTEVNGRISDEQAGEFLSGAVAVVRDVLEMVHGALNSLNRADADKVFAARVEAQRTQDQHIGVQPGEEYSLVKLHPLNSLWRMALTAAKLLDRLLATTNPVMFAQRKKAELDVRAASRQADKMKKNVSVA